ncbi:MAG: cation transporter [Bacteroidales bacterium]|nr:cation transporter [Bacteroidales bacterium]
MEQKTENQVIYKVSGMSCNHCKMSVEKAIASIAGVESVEVDLPSGMAYVKGEHDDNRLINAIKDLGFECEKSQRVQ